MTITLDLVGDIPLGCVGTGAKRTISVLGHNPSTRIIRLEKEGYEPKVISFKEEEFTVKGMRLAQDLNPPVPRFGRHSGVSAYVAAASTDSHVLWLPDTLEYDLGTLAPLTKQALWRVTLHRPVPEISATISTGYLPLVPVTWSLENIAVADLTAFTLSQGEAKTLTEKLQTSLVETKYFNVLSRSDMSAVLKEQQFQKSGNCDDSACLVEMGKILAVQKIIGGTVGKVGNTFSVSLRMVDVETGQTELTADRQLKAEADELLGVVDSVCRELALKYAGKYAHLKVPEK